MVLEEIKCIKRLFSFFLPSNDVFKNRPWSAFIFRGQGDYTWDLVPNVIRNLYYKDKEDCVPQYNHIIEEYLELIIFRNLCDDAGLLIPGDSQVPRTMEGYNSIIKPAIDDKKWPPILFHETLALAQHHGFKTRLLDFTCNPYIALFFAAYQHYNSDQKNDFSVWFTERKNLVNLYKKQDYSYQQITCNGALNNFLFNQNGLFISDEIVQNEKYLPINLKMPDNIYEVRIDSKLVEDVLIELKKMKISYATIFPSYEGLTKDRILYNELGYLTKTKSNPDDFRNALLKALRSN
jgi:hypothetical protein